MRNACQIIHAKSCMICITLTEDQLVPGARNSTEEMNIIPQNSSKLFCSGVPVKITLRLQDRARRESMVLEPAAALSLCPSSHTSRSQDPDSSLVCFLTAS